MRKFKVGDKVRVLNTAEARVIINSYSSSGMEVGKTYTILVCSNYDCYMEGGLTNYYKLSTIQAVSNRPKYFNKE